MLRKLSGWMAWLQEGPLVVDTRPAGDPLADYTLYDAKGQVQGAFQTVDSDSWISAQGTLVLELRDGQAVAQKSTKLSSQESVLDLTPGDNTLIRVYGENIAAVARDRTIARYDLTD